MIVLVLLCVCVGGWIDLIRCCGCGVWGCVLIWCMCCLRIIRVFCWVL